MLHTGDNRTGAGDGDDEQTNIDLNNVPAAIQRITFADTIHDAEARSQNFGQVSNAYVRILNGDSNQELIRYDLGEDFQLKRLSSLANYIDIMVNGSSVRLVADFKVD